MNMAVAYSREDSKRERRAPLSSYRSGQPTAPSRQQARRAAVSARSMMTMLIAISVLFCVLVGLVYIKYLVVETQLDINAVKGKIHDASNEQTRLEEQLDRSMSVQQIMDRATELGMDQPTAGQILYVQFPAETEGESMALEDGN